MGSVYSPLLCYLVTSSQYTCMVRFLVNLYFTGMVIIGGCNIRLHNADLYDVIMHVRNGDICTFLVFESPISNVTFSVLVTVELLFDLLTSTGVVNTFSPLGSLKRASICS